MSAVPARSTGNAAERYRAVFDARSRSENTLTQLRRDALQRFITKGFPTQRDEDWKYTNLRRLESRNFVPAEPTLGRVDESQWIADAGMRIVLLNGRAHTVLSTMSPQPPGVTVLTLGQWLENAPDEVAALLAQQASDASAFESMNLAFCDDGVVIEIGESVRVDRPIYVVHQWTGGAASVMSNPRVFVRAAANSQCTLIEHYVGAADSETLTNSVVTLDIGSGARVKHYRVQQESPRSFHIGSIAAHQARDSRYDCQDIALGASLARTSIVATLQGPGAEANLHGLFLPGGSQHIDTCTLVDHVAPHTRSNEEYRGIADARGRGVYRGKVIVRKDAQKIDSRQSSRNLLLSPTAEIDTRPELEIYANDLKCSHGATTGQLDATSLFYLRSRGLSEAQARALLIRAFAESILSTIELPSLRAHVEQQLNARFAASELSA
ncbi:MAG TPA: Fe-S cluster assembly protein SufD [Povalibacter sp.]|uniref:Fe-S cluster assembly protein SufD n=1 Tax=Povalibacter sp. TaxID=1962978 RepID=UPI002C0DF4B0|nr:Fe-S cluster assembly protein SufD [Povalibacter sp.]HMN43371.1 Fe-S cluster assembly protein SufD [Povalibacter sp.]